MLINRSGLCAATRLIQCQDFGISMNDVSPKFDTDAEETLDLDPEEFKARKWILEQVVDWCFQVRSKREVVRQNKFIPILYRYEIVRGSAKRTRDWGDVVFADVTATKFLLVMIFTRPCDCCGEFTYDDCNKLTIYQANRFFSLAKYIYHGQREPQWIRATYVTKADSYKINPYFFLNMNQAPPDSNRRVIHVTADNFIPSLLESDVERIDNLNAQRKGPKTPLNVRKQVIGSKHTRPELTELPDYWKQKNARQCAHCGEIKEKDLQRCARCKLVYYCGTECQRMAWPTHKFACKKG